MAKKKDAEQGQQMRIQQDGSIIPETPELLTSEEDDAVRKEKLAKASDEVLELMKRNSDKGWIELFLIVDKVEEEQLYLPEYKSITAWGQALADRGGFRLRELWRRKRAGSAYREYEKLKEARVDILPRLKPWDSLDSCSVIQPYRLKYSHSIQDLC